MPQKRRAAVAGCDICQVKSANSSRGSYDRLRRSAEAYVVGADRRDRAPVSVDSGQWTTMASRHSSSPGYEGAGYSLLQASSASAVLTRHERCIGASVHH